MYNWLKFFHPFHWLLIKRRLNFLHLLFSQNRLQQAVILTFKAFLIPSRGWMSSARYGLGWVRAVFLSPSSSFLGKCPWRKVAILGDTNPCHTLPYNAILGDTNLYHTMPYQCHTLGHQPMPYFAIPVHCSGIRGVTVYHTTTYYKTCHTILYQWHTGITKPHHTAPQHITRLTTQGAITPCP